MGIVAWHNRDMRWPWSGFQDDLRLLGEQHRRHIEEYRRFTTELVMDMRRYAEQRERKLEEELAEMREHRAQTRAEHEEFLAEQRAGREALLRILDRLPPPATGTA